MGWGRTVKGALARTEFPGKGRILPLAWRGYERYLTLRSRGNAGTGIAPDGFPLPPPALRIVTVMQADDEFFLTSGRADVGLIRAMLAADGLEPPEPGSLLDFGCGCGRLARVWLAAGGSAVTGCDYNPDLAGWCARNLDGMTAVVNELEPPLPFAPASFDLVYALSVFTHLGGSLAGLWLDELRRVLRPGGRLLLTLQGEALTAGLRPDERERFARGEPVERFEDAEGTNLCAVYHPHASVAPLLARHGFELRSRIAATDASSPATMSQDAYLARVAPLDVSERSA